MGPLRDCLRSFVAGAIIVISVGCGENTPDPSSPTTPSPSALPAGAIINGQVVNPTSGLNASVVGTSLSTLVAGDGRFTLSRVPVTNVQLRFTGPGTNAMLPLGTLQDGDTISIRVMVSGNSATLQSRDDDDNDDPDDDEDDDADDDEDEADELEVTARVSGKAGACPSITFLAGSRAVQTNGSTFFRRVTCELLANGQLVEVEGPVVSGVLRAEEVQLEDAQGVERRGAVTGLSGACPSLTFSVGGSGPTFFTNGTTEFKDLACTAIRNGLAVRADGHIQSNAQALAERVRPQ
jgi:Domain of unknown function (DUF5666)